MITELQPLNRKSEEYWQAIVHEETNPGFHLGRPVDVRPEQLIFHVDEEAELVLPRTDDVVHAVLAGVSGGGKTRLQASMATDDFENGRGATVANGAGDFGDLCLGHVAKRFEETGSRELLDNVEVLWPTPRNTVNLDHYHYDGSGVPSDLQRVDFEYWRATQADLGMSVDLRANSAEDQDMMLRLKRATRNAHIVIATPSQREKRLCPADIRRILLHPHHPCYDRVVEAIKPMVDGDVYWYFRKLASLKGRVRDLEHYTESSLNKQSENYSHPAVENLFCRPGEPSFSWVDAVKDRRFVIIRARPTTRLSPHAARKYIDVHLVQLFDACERLAEQGQRTLHNVYIDELKASGLAEDIEIRLERARGSGLSVKVGVQIIDSMRMGQVDVSPQIFGCCHQVIAFQCKEKETNEYIADYMGTPWRVLSERHRVMDRPDPSKDEKHLMEGWTKGGGRSTTVVNGVASTEGNSSTVSIVRGHNSGQGGARSIADGQHVLANWNNTTGTGSSAFSGESLGESSGHSPIVMDGFIEMIPTIGGNKQASSGTGDSRFDASSNGGARGSSHIEAQSSSWIESMLNSIVRAIGANHSSTQSSSTAISYTKNSSRSIREQLVQRTSEYWEPTGSPRYDIPFQTEVMRVLLSCLSFRHAFMRTKIEGREQTVLFRSPDFPDPFATPEEHQAGVAQYIETLYATKDYIYAAELPEAAHWRRVNAFVDGIQVEDGVPTNELPEGY